MKLSINKLLIGLLFVFSITLIPTNIAKANFWIVSWDESENQCLTTVDLNLSVDSPHKYIVASGGVSDDNGCSGGTIRINGRADTFGTSNNIFTGPTSSAGGGAVFYFTESGSHYITFTGSVSTSISNWSFEIGTLGAYIVSSDPVVTVYANGVNPLTVGSGANVNITWSSTNATACSCIYGTSDISCGSGTGANVSASGNPYTLSESKTFKVTCNN